MDVVEAIGSRRSCRGFRPEPVPRQVLAEVLEAAARAPSAVNLQPWRVWVCTGAELDRLRRTLLARYRERRVGCSPGGGGGGARNLDPEAGPGSFGGLADILAARGAELAPFINEGSCTLYGAPAGVFCFLEAPAPPGRWLDCGIWLGYLTLAAHARGLGACPLGILAAYEEEVKDALFVPPEHTLACAAALGYPDPEAPGSGFRAPRRRAAWVDWVG
ncbi:MAG: nitroreductase [Deferrisomatales bacterium]